MVKMTDENDTRQFDEADFKEMNGTIVKDALKAGTTVIILTPPTSNGAVNTERTAFDASKITTAATPLIKEVYTENVSNGKLYLVDISVLYTDVLNGLISGGKTLAELRSTSTTADGVTTNTPGLIFVDSVHFTEYGADLLAQTVANGFKTVDGLKDYLTIE